MASILEAAMVICFGLSWPISIQKSWRSRTNKGKSFVFMFFIFIGYLCGIGSKLAAGNITYVFVFYVINVVMVTIDLCLYVRNARLDREG